MLKSKAFYFIIFATLCAMIFLLSSNVLNVTQVTVEQDVVSRITPLVSGNSQRAKTSNPGLKLKQFFETGKKAGSEKAKKDSRQKTDSESSKRNTKAQKKINSHENFTAHVNTKYKDTVGRSEIEIKLSQTKNRNSRKNHNPRDRNYKQGKTPSGDKDGRRNKCPDVLDLMLKGRWIPRAMTKEQHEEMRNYYLDTRKQRGLPLNLERDDKLCGNVTFLHPNEKWRAICDPEGPTPCCFQNACVSKPIQQCACTGCYDMRAHIHAEYSTWRPADARCQPKKMTEEEACKVLNGSTVYFMGDSLVRHFYAAFLMAARADEMNGAFSPQTTKGTRAACGGKYLFPYNTRCTHFLDFKASLCNGTASAAFFHQFAHTKNTTTNILEHVSYLSNKPKSLVVIGMGLWYNLDSRKVKEHIILPLLHFLARPEGKERQALMHELSSREGVQRLSHELKVSGSNDLTLPDHSNNVQGGSPDSPNNWNFTASKAGRPGNPRVLWAGIHAPGILKSPIHSKQMYPQVVEYNEDIRQLLQAWGVPMFDTVNMTSQGLMSYDGTHYGLGVNLMKATILLNYLSQLQDMHAW